MLKKSFLSVSRPLFKLNNNIKFFSTTKSIYDKHVEFLMAGPATGYVADIMGELYNNQPKTIVLDNPKFKVGSATSFVQEVINNRNVKEWKPENNMVVLEDGEKIIYDKILLGYGAHRNITSQQSSESRAEFSELYRAAKYKESFIDKLKWKSRRTFDEYFSTEGEVPKWVTKSSATNEQGTLPVNYKSGQSEKYPNVWAIGECCDRFPDRIYLGQTYGMLDFFVGKDYTHGDLAGEEILSNKSSKIYSTPSAKISTPDRLERLGVETSLFLMDQFKEDMDFKNVVGIPSVRSRGGELARITSTVYWAFVDIVWLFLMTFVYVWNNFFIF